MLVTTVRWEFRLTPHYATRRFVCLSDWDEYRELRQDTIATSAWYIKPTPGLDVGSTEAFQLVEFTVDGQSRPIRRSAKQGSQAYSVSLGVEVVDAARPVDIGYTYRTVVPMSSRLVQLRIDQPTKGLSVELDYSDSTVIADVQVLDYITSGRSTQVTKSHPSVEGRRVRCRV